ncbi:MAG TPA: hypothetical protein ENI23_09155 [bacterium]|nr:hypothetical protein [bacterium]
MLVELLTICSIIFITPGYDCDSTWDIYLYNDETIYYNGTEMDSYIFFEKGDSNSTEIHFSASGLKENWYNFSIMYYYLIAGACQCDPNIEVNKAIEAQKELASV